MRIINSRKDQFICIIIQIAQFLFIYYILLLFTFIFFFTLSYHTYIIIYLYYKNSLTHSLIINKYTYDITVLDF